MIERNARPYILSTVLLAFIAYRPLTACAQEETRANNDDVSVTSVADELLELRVLINEQRMQIEKLRSIVEQQQLQLGKAFKRDTAEPPQPSEFSQAPASLSSAETSDGSQAKVSDLETVKGQVEAIAESTTQANQRITKLESDTAEKGKQLGNFSLSGDIRVRYEPFFQEGAVDRHRERFRARLHFTGKLSDEFSGGISLATGALDDPVSTNQTMTGFFNRKNFGLDRAFLSYKPKYAKFLKLDAGKFTFPWYRTPLTFDNDLNPEGFAETLSFDLKSSALENIILVGFQLPFNEVANGHDSFIFGGQFQTHFRLNPSARLSLYGAGINVNRADSIAVALGNGSLRPSLSNSNSVIVSSNGTVTGFATKFAWIDAIAKLDVTASTRFPTMLQIHFVNNVRGSRERSAYWAEALVGRSKEAGDVQFGYTFIRIEKDAVIGAWNESDLRSSTNVLNHRVNFGYQIKNNVSGQFTAWIGKLANPLDNVGLIPAGVRGACTGTNTSGCEDPYLKRLQFDVIYKF